MSGAWVDGEPSKGENDMTDQVFFDNFNDALIAAHRHSRMVECGYAYAVQWPLGHCTVEFRKPSLRDQRMRVIECSGRCSHERRVCRDGVRATIRPHTLQVSMMTRIQCKAIAARLAKELDAELLRLLRQASAFQFGR